MDYKEIEKAERDISQCVLNPDLSISNNPHKYAKKQSNANFATKALCPFCLNCGILAEFRLHKGLRVCPYCGTQLKLETLTELNDIEKFTKFVFNYRFSGFFNKLCGDYKGDDKFNEWNRRLYILGLSKSFWEKYHLLKGDSSKKEEYENDS